MSETISDKSGLGMEPSSFEVESKSYEYIPKEERYGNIPDQQKFWFMANATLLTLFGGAVGALFGLGLYWTLIAIVVGSIVGTIFQALHAAQGPILGLPQMIQSRVQFGHKGALIPLFAAIVVLCGFPLFGLLSGAEAIKEVTSLNVSNAFILITVLAIISAIYGYKLLIKAEKIVAYIVFTNFILLTFAVLTLTPWEVVSSSGWSFVGVGFLAQLGASAMLQLGVAPLVSDYTRYLPEKTSGYKITQAVFGGTLVSAIWLSCLGAVLAAFTEGDLISSIRELGDNFGFNLGLVTMVVAIPASLFTASTGIYSCSVCILSGLESFIKFKTTKYIRMFLLIFMGMIISLLGLSLPESLVQSFGNFLAILGYFLIPWTSVNLVDFYLVRKGKYSISEILSNENGVYKEWDMPGLVSYCLGFIFMIPFFSTSIYTGFAAKYLDGADISFAIGLSVSAISYLIIMKNFDYNNYEKQIKETLLHTV
ncbi:purine-cytosine permease family protein [Vibrio viridaestus]|uniref:Cytosine permease n=1 Tax=Vibrio viridaestus TaxID=2487322 RepID=A0A3N9TKA9_9VIBR|nr:cytosine permease [Vibrio viridaestus]RQW64263.1 cytosine permease [Vibrio viridaestus]